MLSALDQCQAEEKCLMLIKRPKDTARKVSLCSANRSRLLSHLDVICCREENHQI